jgi:hypothetical protein
MFNVFKACVDRPVSWAKQASLAELELGDSHEFNSIAFPVSIVGGPLLEMGIPILCKGEIA